MIGGKRLACVLAVLLLSACSYAEPLPARRPMPGELQRLRPFLVTVGDSTSLEAELAADLRDALAHELSLYRMAVVPDDRYDHDLRLALAVRVDESGTLVATLTAESDGQEISTVGYAASHLPEDEVVAHAAVELVAQLVQQEALREFARNPAAFSAERRAPPDRGALLLATSAARIAIDEQEHRALPGTVPLSVGLHRVHLELDDCGIEHRLVYINPGAALQLRVAPERGLCLARARSGWRVGNGLGYEVGSLLYGKGFLGMHAGRTAMVLNYGISPYVDLRSGLAVMLHEDSQTTGFGLELPLRVRFNLGSVYTMGIGVDVRLLAQSRYYGRPQTTLLGAGLWAHLMGFRFGPRGEWELDIPDFAAIPLFELEGDGSPLGHLRLGASLTYLFLSEDSDPRGLREPE